METQLRPDPVDDPGISFGIATGLEVATFLAAGLVGIGVAATAAAVALVAGIAAARLPILIALALGVIAWAFFTGFTLNGYGQLTLGTGDLARLAGFALGTVAIGYVVRHLAHLGIGPEVRHG